MIWHQMYKLFYLFENFLIKLILQSMFGFEIHDIICIFADCSQTYWFFHYVLFFYCHARDKYLNVNLTEKWFLMDVLFVVM